MKGLETSLIVTKQLVYFCDLLLLYYIFVYPVKSCYFTVAFNGSCGASPFASKGVGKIGGLG